MVTKLLCYAAGPKVYTLNQRALTASARRHGIGQVASLSRSLLATLEKSSHLDTLSASVGAGYWLWKPLIILDALDHADEGDVIVYLDAGADLRRNLDPLVAAAQKHGGVLFWNDYPNRMHVKRDCFVLTGTDTPRYHDARQLDAAFLLILNTARNRAFVRLWIDHCTDPRLLTDNPNTCGKPDLPGFTAHRHDQSVLTLLFLREMHGLGFKTFARRVKHRYIRHHRRRVPWLPIWAWHAFHDGGEFFLATTRRRLRVWRKRLRPAFRPRLDPQPKRDAFSA